MSRFVSRPASERDVAALSSVARAVDPFDFVPASGITARLMTVGPFHLRADEYAALGQFAAGETALLANLDPEGRLFAPSVWEVFTSDYPFERLKADHGWNAIAPSVLWSPKGTWAVVVSNEGHGVVAGSSSFVGELTARLSSGEAPIDEIAARLYIGKPDARDADERLIQMIVRLHGETEGRRVVANLQGD